MRGRRVGVRGRRERTVLRSRIARRARGRAPPRKSSSRIPRDTKPQRVRARPRRRRRAVRHGRRRRADHADHADHADRARPRPGPRDVASIGSRDGSTTRARRRRGVRATDGDSASSRRKNGTPRVVTVRETIARDSAEFLSEDPRECAYHLGGLLHAHSDARRRTRETSPTRFSRMICWTDSGGAPGCAPGLSLPERERAALILARSGMELGFQFLEFDRSAWDLGDPGEFSGRSRGGAPGIRGVGGDGVRGDGGVDRGGSDGRRDRRRDRGPAESTLAKHPWDPRLVGSRPGNLAATVARVCDALELEDEDDDAGGIGEGNASGADRSGDRSRGSFGGSFGGGGGDGNADGG